MDIYKVSKTLLTWTGFAPSAIKVATAVGVPESAIILAYLQGAEMLNGFVAPGRRLCLGLHSAVPEEYTSQAKALFRAGSTWMLGLPVDSLRSLTKPTIARNPANTSVYEGQQVEFEADVRGTEPLTYQWQRGVNNIANATNRILRFSTTMADSGAAFRVAVQNSLGSVTSQAATLTVLADNGKKVMVAFSEGAGTTTTNLGNLAGSGKFAMANGFPKFSTRVPVGPFAPPNNSGSVDFGLIADDQGGRAIDFSNPFGAGIGSYPAVTICGWVNVSDLRTGAGGNRIAFASAGVGGLGFDLVYVSDGSLKLGVNQAPDSAPASTPVITEDANGGSANWIFFGVTYDSALASGNVSYYFGRGDAAAALDSVADYTNGAIETTGILALGNFAAVDLNRNVQGPENSRVFRGHLDEFRIFRSALSLAEIQTQQKSLAQVPAVPVPLTARLAGEQLVISWPAGSSFQLESREQVASGAWSNVTTPPVLVGGQMTVTLPHTGAQRYFRLRSL